MRNYFQFLLVLLFFISCQKETQNNIDISNIEANFKVFRFEQDFYTNKGQNLVELKENFPLLFPDETPDSIWIAKINNPDEQELFQETQKKYNSLLHIEEELSKLFKHIKHYNPTFLAPDVITILSNIDYTYRTIYTDNLLFISGKGEMYSMSLSNLLNESSSGIKKIDTNFKELVKNEQEPKKITENIEKINDESEIKKKKPKKLCNHIKLLMISF